MEEVRGSIRSLLGSIYATHVRRYLPETVAVYNGVEVKTDRIFGADVRPDYEQPLITAVEKYVSSGDTVVVVGGGYGVSTVRAAALVGERGKVIVYEGSRAHVGYIEETCAMNDVSDVVTVRHAIVGEAISLLGGTGTAERLSPAALPSCDCLVMDCEGAEMGIIKNLEISPASIVVETHGHLGSPESNVRDRLTDRGYTIISSKPESHDPPVSVLVATREE